MKVFTIAFCIAIFAIASVYSENNEINDSVPRDEYACPCPRNMDPVCASNGKTYNNECLFDCARRYWKSRSVEIKMVKKGRCEDLPSYA